MWLGLYGAFVAGLYALIAVLRIHYWRQEAAQDARRAAMWQALEAAGYYAVKPASPPAPPRRQWFDADGMLIGAHKSGHLIGPYPFKGDEEEAQTAHRRLLAAGLVGKQGNNYTWTGPNVLSAAKRQLEG